MSRLQALQDERSHKALSAKALVDDATKANKALTPDEVALVEGLCKECDTLDAQIKAIHDTRAAAERLDGILKSNGRVTTPDAPAGAAGASDQRMTVPAQYRRYGRLRNHFGPHAEESAYRTGMWARWQLYRDEKAHEWCLKNGMLGDLRAAHGTTPNSAGGALVPEETANSIIDLREKYGIARQHVRVWPMGRDTLTIPRRAGGLTIGAVGENPASSMGESTTSWNVVQLTAKKCGGFTRFSSEIAEDAIVDLGDLLVGEAAYAFSLFEDQCLFIGDGTSTYLGINGLGNILTAASGLAGAVDAATGHDLLTEIDATDLATLMGKLPEYARMNAKFFCSAVAAELVFGRLQATAGGNTVQTLQGTTGRQYLGYPIVVSQVLPTVTTAINNVPMFYFGDLSLSTALGDRREMRILVSEHRFMELDQVAVSFLSRIDIVNHDVGNTTTAGPIVAMIGNT